MQTAVVRLLGLRPDVTLAVGTEALETFQKRTQSVPIVFAIVSDPLGAGLVRSLARPGGNVTGFMNFEYTIVGKWIGLLKELAPSLSHIRVIDFPDKATWPGYGREIDA